MKYLKALLGRVGEIDLSNTTGVEDPVAEDENVIGELSDEFKQFYTYLCNLNGQIKDDIKEVKECLMNTSLEKAIPKIQKKVLEIRATIEEYELVRKLFWREVQEEFSTDNSLGIRDGFKVVTLKEKDKCDYLAYIIARMFD